jgi:hypothetical protein
MMEWLASLAVLVPLVSPAGGTGSDDVPADLEFASVVVTDGMHGGNGGSTPLVRLAAAFDRVERAFRVVRRKDGPPGEDVWVAEIEPEQFQLLIEVALTSGLLELPRESPTSGYDTYGKGRQIRLDYGESRWANGTPVGRPGEGSRTLPTEDQRRRFDQVIVQLERAVDALPLSLGSRADLERVPILPDLRAMDTYRRVLDHLLADPLRHGLDLHPMRVSENRAQFCWRARPTGSRSGDVEFRLLPSGEVVRWDLSNDRPEDFVPVETGMTLEAVLARLGPPDERRERRDGSLVLTYSTTRSPNGTLGFHTVRMRFEGGRLAAP